MGIGKMTKHMAMESTLTQTEPSMRVIGLMISSMVRVRRNGLMVLGMKVIISSERKMDSEGSYGRINLFTKETSWTIIFMGTANTNGQTAENSQASGT